MEPELEMLSAEVGRRLKASGVFLATAESCTGGWAAQVITATAGSSEWFERGFVTYSNAAKLELLGVDADALLQRGAVSEQTAREMAQGAIRNSRAQVALAITGIAGPGGGTPDKPVGMVCFAWAFVDRPTSAATRNFAGDRETIRRQSVVFALTELLKRLT